VSAADFFQVWSSSEDCDLHKEQLVVASMLAYLLVVNSEALILPCLSLSTVYCLDDVGRASVVSCRCTM